MKRYLLIGGAGFIGINFAKALIDQGNKVTILDNLKRKGSTKNLDWLSTNYNVDLVVADIRHDINELQDAISNCDVIYHLAAQVAVTTSIKNPVYDFEVNARGMINILEAVRLSGNECSIVYASTNKVYGKLDDKPVQLAGDEYVYTDLKLGISEDEPLDLYSPYGCSKGIAEIYLKDYARTYGLRGCAIRQSCIYGPHQMGVEDQGWVAWFMIAAKTGKPITIFGDGYQVRDVLHVQDLFDLWQASETKIESQGAFTVYNAGGGIKHTLSLKQLLDELPVLTGANSIEIGYEAERLGDQKVYISDISKARNELQWQPKISVADGLKDLAGWIDDNKHLFEG